MRNRLSDYTCLTSLGSQPPLKSDPPKNGLLGFGRKMSAMFSKLVVGEPEPEIQIGSPYNFQHVQHVQIDPHSSTGFSVI